MSSGCTSWGVCVCGVSASFRFCSAEAVASTFSLRRLDGGDEITVRSSCAAGLSIFFTGFLVVFFVACFLAARGVEDLVFVFFAGFLVVFFVACFFAGFLDDRFLAARGVEDLVFVFFAGFLVVFFVACFFDGRFAFFAVDVAPCVSRGSSACVFAFAIISFRQI